MYVVRLQGTIIATGRDLNYIGSGQYEWLISEILKKKDQYQPEILVTL